MSQGDTEEEVESGKGGSRFGGFVCGVLFAGKCLLRSGRRFAPEVKADTEVRPQRVFLCGLGLCERPHGNRRREGEVVTRYDIDSGTEN